MTGSREVTWSAGMNVSQEESLSRGQAESVIQQGPECGTANVALENWRETRRSVRLLYYEASGNMRMVQ
jgi:hypothetical protein